MEGKGVEGNGTNRHCEKKSALKGLKTAGIRGEGASYQLKITTLEQNSKAQKRGYPEQARD